jgi:hypothetical protein
VSRHRSFEIVRADQSSRFANGDWRDVSAVLPIVDPFVRAVGDVPHVIGSFLTLCESAIEHYPPSVFIDLHKDYAITYVRKLKSGISPSLQIANRMLSEDRVSTNESQCHSTRMPRCGE